MPSSYLTANGKRFFYTKNMAKRFTDNEKWKDAWFMDLPAKYKLFWIYILDECSHAGVWKVNFKVASFYIGEHLEHSEVKRIMKDRITILDDDYWYINKFIKFQYKCDIESLNLNNNAHLSILKILNEYDKFKPLTSPLLTPMDKDKDKVKEEKKEVIKIQKTEEEIKTETKKEKLIFYNEECFLKDWNELRKSILNKPSNRNRIGNFDSIENFKELLKHYTQEDFKNSITGLFKQEVMPHGNEVMRTDPKHLLQNFERYLTAYDEKNAKLYGEKKKVDRL